MSWVIVRTVDGVDGVKAVAGLAWKTAFGPVLLAMTSIVSFGSR